MIGSGAREQGLSARRMILGVVFVVCIAVSGFALADEPPGEIRFEAENALVVAKGIFQSWHFAEINRKPGGLGVESAVVVVDLESLDTNNERRDKHLRTADFFDVERFSTATMRIYDIAAAESSADHFVATIDFDLHGVKKTFPGVKIERLNAEPLEIRGTLVVDRMDFGIGKPKSFNPMSIKNEVPISFTAKMPEA